MKLFPQVVAISIAVLAASPLMAQDASGDFTIEVEHWRLPAISQDNTGTCWSYATTSFFESEVHRIHKESVDLSEMYTVYCAYLEKVRRFVRLHGTTQFGQGGLSHDLLVTAKNYGLAPASAYTGLCDGQTSHNHSELETLLKAMIEPLAKSRRPSAHWENGIRGVLDAYLGEAPETVKVHGRSMTPLRYTNEVLQLPLDDYVSLMSYQYTPFGEEGELLVPDNWLRYDDYWNMPIEELLQNLDHAIRSGYTVAVDIDVSERTNDRAKSVYKLSDALEKKTITDTLRQRTFDTRETTDDHLMHIVGLAKDESGKLHYLTKNSWGNGGPFKGHMMMTRNYVALKTLAFMVHRDALLAETREKFEQGAR